MANRNLSIESKTKEAVLQQGIKVKIGGKSYEVAPPTIATLILVSEAVARIPKISLDKERITQEVLYMGKDGRVIGEIIAILILGADKARPRQRFGVLSRLWQWLNPRRTRLERLTEDVIRDLSPKAALDMLSRLLATLELGDFFGITTFLTEINLLHQTREVVS